MERTTKPGALAIPERGADLHQRDQTRDKPRRTPLIASLFARLCIPSRDSLGRASARSRPFSRTTRRMAASLCAMLAVIVVGLVLCLPGETAGASGHSGFGVSPANDVLIDDALRPANSLPDKSGPTNAPDDLWLNPRSSYTDTVVKGTGDLQWPARGPISQGFSRGHRAIDIEQADENPIQACDSGQVIFAGWDKLGLGWAVKINHGDGYSSIYGHNSKLLVRRGQYVQKGDVVALAGSTGNSTGTHLHFMVLLDGVPQNPMQYLPK